MKIVEITEGVGKIVQGVNTTVDVKPGETERQAKKFFGGNGKPKHLGVKGATPNQAFNLGLTEGYKIQLERDPNMYVLHITDTKSGKRTEVRGKSGYESGSYDANDKLHQLLDKIGKSANISELINGEVVTINPKHPDASKAQKAADVAFNEAFDTKLDWKKEGTRYTAMIGDKKVTIDYDEKPIYTGDKHEMGIEVNFSVNGRYDVTGTGDANAVFGAVYNHIAQWVSQVKPEVFEFSASKRASDSRASLYARMVKRFAAQLGYTHHKAASKSVSSSIGDTFVLLRNDIAKQRGITEAWSKKYKNSIDCNNPKGFSQKAHCAGKRKR